MRLFKAIGISFALLTAAAGQAATSAVTFTGITANRAPFVETPGASSGLEAVYVLWGVNNAQAHYAASSSGANVRWQRFSNLGGGFAEDVASYHNGADSYIDLAPGDMGYIVEEGTKRTCFWVVDYSKHLCDMQSLTVMPDQSECDRLALGFVGNASKINYFSVNGVPQTLSRGLKLQYSSLQFSQESFSYVQTQVEETLDEAAATIRVTSPLCQTFFTLSGDRFLEFWGMGESVESAAVDPMAIAVTTKYELDNRQNDNEQRDESTDAIGGSGPVDVTFVAATTDAVVYREWQVSTDPDFDIIELRFQQEEVEHEFRDSGTRYVRFVAGNDAATCEYISDTYTIYIGESRLDCPNAFSPGATEGTNDEWKVSYKSIVSFECSIFNRWGLQMAHFTDPSQGWDGKYKGKLVPSGVYYYVIRARGADGKQYKLSGDINIIKFEDNRIKGSAD